MQYLGSKARVPLPYIILKDRKPGQLYIEPFVGSASVIIQVVPSMFIADGPRLGADKNPYVIAMFQALQSGWKAPESVAEEEYNRLRDLYRSGVVPIDLFERALMGFVGCACSFGAMFFQSFCARDKRRPDVDYAAVACRSLPTREELAGIDFVVSDYVDLAIPNGALVYCDPPYENTAKYEYTVDHAAFWKWCSTLVERGCSVFVSSYEDGIPADWKIVWRREHHSILGPGHKKLCVEVVATK